MFILLYAWSSKIIKIFLKLEKKFKITLNHFTAIGRPDQLRSGANQLQQAQPQAQSLQVVVPNVLPLLRSDPLMVNIGAATSTPISDAAQSVSTLGASQKQQQQQQQPWAAAGAASVNIQLQLFGPSEGVARSGLDATAVNRMNDVGRLQLQLPDGLQSDQFTTTTFQDNKDWHLQSDELDLRNRIVFKLWVALLSRLYNLVYQFLSVLYEIKRIFGMGVEVIGGMFDSVGKWSEDFFDACHDFFIRLIFIRKKK